MTLFLCFDGDILHFLQLNKLLLFPLQLFLNFLLILLTLEFHLTFFLFLCFYSLHLALLFIELSVACFLEFGVKLFILVLLVDFIIVAASRRVVETIDATLHFFNDLNI